MNQPMNGTPQGPPLQVHFNVNEIAPGFFRWALQVGPVAVQFDLPTELFEQLLRRAFAEIQKSKSNIVVVPPGALPNGGASG